MRSSVVAMLTACLVMATAGVAHAYPNELPGYSGDLSRSECVDCHSASEQDLLNPGADPDLLATVRKGPHGHYATGTNRCQTCHVLHQAPAGGSNLLPGETIMNTCECCHDGTAGTAVYGVIKARTGSEPASAHGIEQVNSIPGGNVDGGSLVGSFTGPGGTLTCSDCHSPHDTGTVEPFTGDRLRSTVASDTAYTTKTNRLLRRSPTGSATTVAVYGAGWCATCHTGRANQHGPDSGAMEDHPVQQDGEYYYDQVPVVLGVGSIETALGGLGQSNRGYVMPEPTLSEPPVKTALQEGEAPLCQQCHEDGRDTGPSIRETTPTLKNAAQEFLVTQPDGLSTTDNPRFQVFPHESDSENFLVREPGPTEPNSLCLNCHSLIHDASPPSDYVLIFADGDHDSAQPAGDPYDVFVDCDICHNYRLIPMHAEECVTCHSAPYDTLTTWNHGCQEGGCHTTYHAGSPAAHSPLGDSQCGLCHVNPGFQLPDQTRCQNCHSVYSASDVTPPVTNSDAQASYIGAAVIDFSITEGGKVGVGVTLYQVDGGPTIVGGPAVITTPGAHTLTFWSIDQNGNVETPAKTANFSITADTTPPVTTSNAPTTQYYYPAQITLTATDASTFGVKATYYSLDGGPTQTGTHVTVPAPSGIIAHTLDFWSEDWSGNVETTKTANFTVIGGTGTLRLGTGTMVADEWVEWLIWRGPRDATPDYTVYHEGPYNSGPDDLVLPVSGTGYWVVVSWGDASEPYDEASFGYYYLTTPGAIVEVP